MGDTLYEDFTDPGREFENEPRAFCYRIARNMVEKAKKSGAASWLTQEDSVKGILLLLFTWNYAAPITKSLTHKDIRDLLERNADRLHALDHCSILADIDEQNWRRIEETFDDFKATLGQTGASKALSLLNPDLFVMWDTAIRKRLRGSLIRGISNGESGAKYVRFLSGIQDIIEEYDIPGKLPEGCCVAKKIDEFHYTRIVMKE